MPELPEVEVICRGLRPHIIGRRIRAIQYDGKKLRTEVPIEVMRQRLCGAVFTGVERRAKYLIFSTDSNDLLIVHLGMTGKLCLFKQGSPAATHDHLVFVLDRDIELRFNDTRRFGSVHFFESTPAATLEKVFFHNTGVEPFSSNCCAALLHKRARRSRQAVKTFIMNASILAGVGNIYANESLFAAKIHPETEAGKLSIKDWQRLIAMIRKILDWAIECGGSTINDFLDAGGKSGYFQVNFKVYGRNGKPCHNCTTCLQRRVISGRASFFCPQCQKLK